MKFASFYLRCAPQGPIVSETVFEAPAYLLVMLTVVFRPIVTLADAAATGRYLVLVNGVFSILNCL
jgi:hypothetical protein